MRGLELDEHHSPLPACWIQTGETTTQETTTQETTTQETTTQETTTQETTTPEGTVGEKTVPEKTVFSNPEPRNVGGKRAIPKKKEVTQAVLNANRRSPLKSGLFAQELVLTEQEDVVFQASRRALSTQLQPSTPLQHIGLDRRKNLP